INQQLYDSFVQFINRLSITFRTQEDALMQRNAVLMWDEFSTLCNIFTDELSKLKIEIPDLIVLKSFRLLIRGLE
ncbi:unnamed protein product, partial [marine sediment metagenome]